MEKNSIGIDPFIVRAYICAVSLGNEVNKEEM
jgi:hypothetical protein